MASRVSIRFHPLPDDADVRRHVWFFGEELWGLCRDLEYATMSLDEVDRAVDVLTFTIGPAKKVRRTLRLVEDLLERWPRLAVLAHVSVERVAP